MSLKLSDAKPKRKKPLTRQQYKKNLENYMKWVRKSDDTLPEIVGALVSSWTPQTGNDFRRQIAQLLQQQIEITIEAYKESCKKENLNIDYCIKNNLDFGICYYLLLNQKNFKELFKLMADR